LLKELLSELELREEHCTISKSESSQYTRSDKDKKKKDKLNTRALLAKMNDFCVYCKGGHAHQDCTIVKSVEERRQLLRRYRYVLFVHVRGIFLMTVILSLLVVFVKGNITFPSAIRAIAQTGINSVAPRMVIEVTC